MNLRFLALGAVALAAIPMAETHARACGGCFRPSQVVSVVNAHRMVFSVSQQQSILWDQFEYTGNPQDFAWVLPVHAASAKVELAHDEFIAALDAYSSPIIQGPTQSNGGGFGCGASNASYEGPNGGGVQVVNQEVVGPYEVATLRATDPNALESWLASHGYEIPASVQPTIAAYVSGGFDFIALRLQPGQGVAAMQPVRVVTSGADPTLPLRMVAAGVGSDVSILLYVISEGRYEAANFNNTQVDFTKLQWNKNSNTSNYDTLIQTAMTSGDGRNFTVEFAGHLFSQDFSSNTFNGNQSFASIYTQSISQAQKCPYQMVHGADFPVDAGPGFPDASFGDSSTTDANTTDADLDGATTDADLDAATADADTDAGTTTTDGGSGDGGTGSSYDKCNFDDLTTATAGMNQADVFLTRLRADLKVSALDQDLVLKAAADQTPYDNIHQATQTGDGCSTTSEAPGGATILAAFGALAALLLKRRAK